MAQSVDHPYLFLPALKKEHINQILFLLRSIQSVHYCNFSKHLCLAFSLRIVLIISTIHNSSVMMGFKNQLLPRTGGVVNLHYP